MGCCNHPPTPGDPTPGPLRRASTALSAAYRFVLGGMRLVTDSQYEERMKRCDEPCPYQKVAGQCSACGCILELKARMPGEHCPHGRWPLL